MRAKVFIGDLLFGGRLGVGGQFILPFLLFVATMTCATLIDSFLNKKSRNEVVIAGALLGAAPSARPRHQPRWPAPRALFRHPRHRVSPAAGLMAQSAQNARGAQGGRQAPGPGLVTIVAARSASGARSR